MEESVERLGYSMAEKVSNHSLYFTGGGVSHMKHPILVSNMKQKSVKKYLEI